MERLNANKTKLHALVRRYEELPGMRSVGFTKAPRQRRYRLEWYSGGLRYDAHLSSQLKSVLLSVTAYDCDGREVYCMMYKPSEDVLNDLGLLENGGPHDRI